MEYLTLLPAFGFDTFTRTEAVIKKYNVTGLTADHYMHKVGGIAHNIMKGIAYLPIANIIIGALTLEALCKKGYFGGKFDVEGKREIVPLLIFRAVSEILFGPLLAIVDLIKSLVDHHIAKRILASS